PPQANAAAACFNLHRPRDVAQFNIPAPGRYLQLAAALLDVNIPAARFQGRALRARNQNNVSASRRSVDLALRVGDVDLASPCLQVHVAVHRPDLDPVPPGPGRHRPANIVQLYLASAALGLHPAGDAGYRDVSAGSLQLRQIQIAGDVDHELARAEVVMPTLPVAFDPCRISADRSADLVSFKFPPGMLLIGTVRTSAYDVGNFLLRTALHANRAEVYIDAEILCGGERPRHFLGPRIPGAVYPYLLRSCDRNQDCRCREHPGEL